MADRLTKSQDKKEQLLALAQSGAKRPPMSDTLSKGLNNYTSKASHSYDEEFSNKIRALAPSWFRPRKKKEVV